MGRRQDHVSTRFSMATGTTVRLADYQPYPFKVAQRNTRPLHPIAPTGDALDLSNQRPGNATAIPGLRPLEDGKRRPLQQWLPAVTRPQDGRQGKGGGLGLLQLNLSQPSAIDITSEGGDRTALRGSQGSLALQLLAPINLTVTPPLKTEDQVLWNGKPQTPLDGQPGRYRLPQSEPRSP